MPAKSSKKIEIENIISPGRVTKVDAEKYEAMKKAFLKVLPSNPPGLTADQIGQAVFPLLPDGLFPGGAKVGWWKKAIQLDLEAKHVVMREKTKPLRWHKA